MLLSPLKVEVNKSRFISAVFVVSVGGEECLADLPESWANKAKGLLDECKSWQDQCRVVREIRNKINAYAASNGLVRRSDWLGFVIDSAR